MTAIQTQFEKFHDDNPHVYLILETLAAQWFDGGHDQAGIGMLWEVMRWEIGLRTADSFTPFQLNNNYRSRYVRMLMARNPEWVGRFQIRKLVTK